MNKIDMNTENFEPQQIRQDTHGRGRSRAISYLISPTLLMIALPSSESASYRSGGRRSFSISDFRLRGDQTKSTQSSCKTYASSKPVMASLMPSVPAASVPYGSLLVPEMFLSSDTFSDSSL